LIVIAAPLTVFSSIAVFLFVSFLLMITFTKSYGIKYRYEIDWVNVVHASTLTGLSARLMYCWIDFELRLHCLR